MYDRYDLSKKRDGGRDIYDRQRKEMKDEDFSNRRYWLYRFPHLCGIVK